MGQAGGAERSATHLGNSADRLCPKAASDCVNVLSHLSSIGLFAQKVNVGMCLADAATGFRHASVIHLS
jgi:hypothetical protein